MNIAPYPKLETNSEKHVESSSHPRRTRSIARWLFVFALLSNGAFGQSVINIELVPSLTGSAPGRERPRTPSLHLDLLTSQAFPSGEFLVDSINATPSGPTFTFDSNVQGWFSEPEEAIEVSLQPVGIQGGSMSLASSFGFRDSWTLEHSYDVNWNPQRGYYSAISLRVLLPDPSMKIMGADFVIDDGTQSALYSIVPEPSSLVIFAAGSIGLLIFGRRFGGQRNQRSE